MGQIKNIKLHIVTDIKIMAPKFTYLLSITQTLVDLCDSSAALTVIIIFVFMLCAHWWRKQKIQLDCWFCGHINFVRRSSRKWWMCTGCTQFNGFNNDGSYAREIPEMYKGSSNKTKFCEQEKFMKTTNLLCRLCIKNQQYIVQALADFNPSSECSFDEEVEHYRKELNGQYGLCMPCKTGVDNHLRAQDELIRNEHNRNISNTTPKNERKVRKLSMTLNNDSVCLVVLYNMLHVASMCASHWLSSHHRAHFKTDLVLFNISLIFVAFVIFLYFYVDKYDAFGVLVSLGWVAVLFYGNFKTRDSRYLRSVLLLGIVVVERIYLGYEILLFVCRLWKSILYKRERKVQLEKIKRSPKLRAEMICGSTVVTASSQPSISTATTANHFPSCNEAEVKPLSSEHKRLPSTPDLLEGHLDAMFIQRKTQVAPLLKDGNDKNHVVSALKYRGVATTSISPSSRVPGQVLKPATFSSHLLRPSLFHSTSHGSVFMENETGQTKTEEPTLPCTGSKNEVAEVRESDKDRKIGSGLPTSPTKCHAAGDICKERSSVMNILVIFFVASILTNLVLVYQLILVR